MKTRLITIQNKVPLHEAVSEILSKEMKREVKCGPYQNGEEFGKLFFMHELVDGCNQTHVGSWQIRNGYIQSFITEEVEYEPEQSKVG